MPPVELLAAKYQLEHVLGSGGMGEVWAAVNQITGRPVAIKRMHSSTPELRARMLREARAVGTLKHKHIVDIYDVGETETGDPFLVMERLHGESLGDRLERLGHLPPAAAVSIAASVAAALKVAHAKGIVHRDLKPDNVFLHREADGDEEVVKVLDFGVSKHLQDARGSLTVGSLVGSPPYMSPEQAEAGSVDARTDLWSLGVVLFEMLAGHRPFAATSPYLVISEIVHGPIPSIADAVPGLPPALVHVVERCLTRDVNARVASADEVIRLLGACVEERPGRDVVTLKLQPMPRAMEPVVTPPSTPILGTPVTPAAAHTPGFDAGPGRRSVGGVGFVVGAAALVFVVVFGLTLRWALPTGEGATSTTASGTQPHADDGAASSTKPLVSAEPRPTGDPVVEPSHASDPAAPTSSEAAVAPDAKAGSTKSTSAQAPAPASSQTASQTPSRRHASGEKRLVLP